MLKREVAFGVDSFGKPKVLSDRDSLAQLIINILYLRPGQLPSMPMLGIDIYNYITPSVGEEGLNNLSTHITKQCSVLAPYIELTGTYVKLMTYQGRPILLIIIPISYEGKTETLLVGARKDTNGRVIFNYEFDDTRI